MYAFWSSVMLTSGYYSGDPVSSHRKVRGIAPPLFGNWLDLFEATATELFVPEIADRFVHTARRIAENLKLALFRPGRTWAKDLRRRRGVSSTCA
jgi:hemoglobin